MTVTISTINLYPVKSLGGSKINQGQLLFSGFSHDREWMLVKPDNSFMTLRSHPQMAMVQAIVEDEQLLLKSFGMETHSVPATNASMKKISTAVFGNSVQGNDVGDETAEWISQAIGDDCRLVAFAQDQVRQCDPEVSKQGDHTKFADAFPLLIVSEESLQDLNNRLDNPVTMDRFRPNIVVRGCEPFGEDNWRSIRINDLPLRVVAACARCSVPTVDPATGVMSGPEPIHTLSSFRQRDNEIYFGVNAIPDREGSIIVGDKIEITS